MASTFSELKFELIGTGDQAGNWGDTTNNNIGTAIEQAITGLGNPVFATDADLTLSFTDTVALQTARALVLNTTSTGSLTATRQLIVPTIEKQYIVQNNTTGSQSITVKTAAGTGITVPNGAKMHLYVDGVNVVDAVTHFSTLTLGSALPVTSGGTGVTNPSLVQGTNVTITGTWPNQTINSTASGGGGTFGTPQTATGTAVTFTGIPSSARRITLMFSNINTNGTSIPIVQIGTAGGFITTGYLGSGTSYSGSNIGTASSFTTGFGIAGGVGPDSIAYAGAFSDATYSSTSGGSVDAGASVDSIKITTVNGTDSFDSGTVNILYDT